MLPAAILVLLAGTGAAEFDWTKTSGGSGSFALKTRPDEAVVVGEIPPGLQGVVIRLKADDEADLQLCDKLTGEQIVGWPHGLLSEPERASKSYHGLRIEYSGFYGDGSGPGHEYLRIPGETKRTLVVKVFSLKARTATVSYSWKRRANSGPHLAEPRQVAEIGKQSVRRAGGATRLLARQALGLVDRFATAASPEHHPAAVVSKPIRKVVLEPADRLLAGSGQSR